MTNNTTLATAVIYAVAAVSMTVFMFLTASVGWAFGHVLATPQVGAMCGIAYYIWGVVLNMDELGDKLDGYISNLVAPF